MPHSRTIRAERHQDLARLIQRDVGVLIERWSRRSLEETPGADAMHRDVLLDHMSSFVSALATSLGEADADGVGGFRTSASQHGAQRWIEGWSLPNVVRDYQLMRTVLLQFLDEGLDRPLTLSEVLAVNLAFDEAIAASAGMYVAHRDEAVRQAERARVERERQGEEDRLRRRAEGFEEIDRRKDEFLAVLGHELRNPLAPIRNVLQVLHLRAPDATTLNWARGVVERQVRHMTRLVDDLLDVTRIGGGKLQIKPERVDFCALVRSATDDHRPTLEAAGLTLEVDIPATPLWVRGDQVRLGQVVGNVLHNATKFTTSGGQVGVHLATDAEWACLTVRDTGIGIEAAELPVIFETFRQSERSRHQSQGGLGLGLALVKGFTELHGGSVAASSAGPGQGSTFTIWLPLDQAS